MPTPLPNHDIDGACRSAAGAFTALSQLPPEFRAQVLDAIATALDAQRGLILETASAETALTTEELTPELARTTGTLRMFASLVRDGSWCRAAIDTPVIQSPRGHAGATGTAPPQPAHDTANPRVTAGALHAIGPNHDLRSLLIPLGPVAVFGSSNFPLAYGVCGGDTASALAAGCPVIIKEHPAHPITGRLLAGIAQEAIAHAFDEPDAQARVPAPSGTAAQLLQYIQSEDPKDFSIAQQLVQHSLIAAVGFTGSTTAGMALHRLAEQRSDPVPVFAEMGSLNAVFIWPKAFAARAERIADSIAQSILTRVGQQCTKPGVVCVHGRKEREQMYDLLRQRLTTSAPRRMLSPTVAASYYRRLDKVSAAAATNIVHSPLPTARQRDESLGVPVVFAANAIATTHETAIWEEIFGPAVVVAESIGFHLMQFRGALTATVYAETDEDVFLGHDPLDLDALFDLPHWLERLGQHAGRIIFNGPPTGVRVATSMVHGGPFPATNRPDTTAVGPRAIERWCRPICFQNCPDALLPAELQNANPRTIWRTVNGELSRDTIL